uniref:Gb protein n=1 Tax=Solanum tuberosum TaxID=4113 RepID=M1AV41_SOLTU
MMTNEPSSRRDKESYNKMNKNSFSNMRCPHCTGPLSKEMIGSAVGGTTSAFYGFNHVMPIVRRCVKGPMWLHFLVGAPPVIVFSSACAGLAGGAVPAFAQLASSSYHAVISSSTLPPTASQDENMRKF